LDPNTESILFLTNESDRPARMGFSVTANGVHYSLTELRLNPHETRVIDLRKLRAAGSKSARQRGKMRAARKAGMLLKRQGVIVLDEFAAPLRTICHCGLTACKPAAGSFRGRPHP
jgi:hypothetical protein